MKTLSLIISILPLIFFSSCKQAQKQQKAKEAEKELHESLADLRNSQAKTYDETGEVGNDKGAVDKVIHAAKKMEESGSKGKAAEGAAVRIWMGIMKREEAILTKGADHIEIAVDYSKIKKKEDIAKLTAEVRKYQAINQASIKGIKGGWIQEVKDQMKKENISTALIKKLSKSLQTGFNTVKPTLLVIRKTDVALCEGILEQHAVLTEFYGKWNWDPKEEVPQFTEDAPDASLDRYNAAAEKIGKAANEQAAAQQKLMKSR